MNIPLKNMLFFLFFFKGSYWICLLPPKRKLVKAITIILESPSSLGTPKVFLCCKLIIWGIFLQFGYFKYILLCFSPPTYATLIFGQSYSILWHYTKICIYNQFSHIHHVDHIWTYSRMKDGVPKKGKRTQRLL
jgi:hypothetical protein